MSIVNLTPHDIRIRVEDSSEAVELPTDVVIPPSGTIARVSSVSKKVKDLEGIGIYDVSWGEVVGLPDPQDETTYVVSSMVASVVPYRYDLFTPKGEGTIRFPADHPNERMRGQIFAVRGLQRTVYK
jgi:hypothetical protein